MRQVSRVHDDRQKFDSYIHIRPVKVNRPSGVWYVDVVTGINLFPGDIICSGLFIREELVTH